MFGKNIHKKFTFGRVQMSADKIQFLIAMILYLAVLIVIGIIFLKRASKNTDEYFLGGRGLGPWVAAFSAEASDMSGWLLMGLPGVAYWCGLADAFWTAVGLAIGTYINWLIVAKRLRKYSQVAGNSITLPDFFHNRFKEKKPYILIVSSLFILVFFAVYVASCFVTGGKLFAQIFGASYHSMLIITALVVVAYTLMGGFWAESVSDFIQAIIMIFALVAVFVVGVVHAGGFGAILENIKSIPGFAEFFGIASPQVFKPQGADAFMQMGIHTDALDASSAMIPLWNDAGGYGLLTIISTMAWGLGYFGMPQVLLRFFAIRKVGEIRRARVIAIIWCVIAMAVAVFIGLMGRVSIPYSEALNTTAKAESIFIVLSQTLFHPLFAGLVMAGILAAAMSSSDSYLLIAASAVSKNIFKGAFKKNATDKQIMGISRIALCVIALVGIAIAWNENSVIFQVVSFAWAGFGAAFGPLVLFSLFWKRTTNFGAMAGIVGGGLMVFLWKLVIRPWGGVWNIYELLPAFIFGCICIVLCSVIDNPPKQAILDEFELVKTIEID
jgi:sodium/proline symporter